MATRKNGGAGSRGEKDADLRSLYAELRKQFSAADLQKYTEIEEGVPLAQVIKEMAEIHRQEARKRKRK